MRKSSNAVPARGTCLRAQDGKNRTNPALELPELAKPRENLAQWFTSTHFLQINLICNFLFFLLCYVTIFVGTLTSLQLLGGRIAQQTPFSLRTQRPRVQFLAFPRICLGVDEVNRRLCSLGQWTAEA